MAVRWTIDHSAKRVEVTLEGDTGPDEAARFFDALEAAQAIPYSKLLDATLAVVKIDNRVDRKSTRLNSSHIPLSRMPSSA